MHSTAHPTTEFAWALRSFVATFSCSCCYRTTVGCAKRTRHAPYSCGASSSGNMLREGSHAPLQETGTVQLRRDPTVSQLHQRVPWPPDTELLVRRRLPFHEPESPAVWMGCAVGVRSRGSPAAITRCRTMRRRSALRSRQRSWSMERAIKQCSAVGPRVLSIALATGTGPSCGYARST